MAARPRKRRRLSRFVAPLATMLILGYFGYHAFHGQYGIRAHLATKQRIATLEAELADRTAVRDRLEARVMLLRDGSMERDMVDEQVRRQLGMVRASEVVLLHN